MPYVEVTIFERSEMRKASEAETASAPQKAGMYKFMRTYLLRVPVHYLDANPEETALARVRAAFTHPTRDLLVKIAPWSMRFEPMDVEPAVRSYTAYAETRNEEILYAKMAKERVKQRKAEMKEAVKRARLD